MASEPYSKTPFSKQFQWFVSHYSNSEEFIARSSGEEFKVVLTQGPGRGLSGRELEVVYRTSYAVPLLVSRH